MAASIKIPYYAHGFSFPLPTEDEIEAAPDITLAYGGRRVVEINAQIVVKFGKGVDLIEGENMLFVREKTQIPVPRVYAMYSKAGKNYIVMERIIGQTLLSLWPQLSSADKETIVSTLRGNLEELRALQPPSYYGSIGERRPLNEMFWTREPEAPINGPFTSHAALIEALALKYTYDGRPIHKADFYRQCLPHVLRENSPTFTHGDIQRKNIIVQRLADDVLDSESQNEWQVTILDWEASGWYPSYWEYSFAFCSVRWDDDWGLWIRKALNPRDAEAAWMQAIYLELWS